MGLIGIRYGKVIHCPCSPAWAQSNGVPKTRLSASRITPAAGHRFTVLCSSSSIRIRSSLRRVLPALLPRTHHGLNLGSRCTLIHTAWVFGQFFMIQMMPRVLRFYGLQAARFVERFGPLRVPLGRGSLV